jgi:hypothetical protein
VTKLLEERSVGLTVRRYVENEAFFVHNDILLFATRSC